MTIHEQIGPRKVLLIDRDPWIRDSLSMLLGCESCQVTALDNAADGLRALAAHGFDVILCDTSSPEIDGVAFLERAGQIRPDAFRILIAGYPIGEIAAVAARAGIHHCLPKPFTIDILKETLRALARNAPRRDGGGTVDAGEGTDAAKCSGAGRGPA